MLALVDYTRWKAVVVNGLTDHGTTSLTDRDREFLASMAARFDQYGRGTYLSEKQIPWLERLEELLREELGPDYED